MKSAHETRDRCERVVGLRPIRIGRNWNVASDELQSFTPVVVDTNRPRRADESSASDAVEKAVDCPRVLVRRTQDLIADANNAASIGDAALQFDRLVTAQIGSPR